MLKTIKKMFFAAGSTALALPAMVSAAVNPGDYGVGAVEYGPNGAQSLPEAIAKILQVILGVLGAIAVLLIVIAGILYMTSGGDEGRVETAKKFLIYAIVGLVVAILGYIIVNTVISVLQ